MIIPGGMRVTLWHDDYGSFTNFPAARIAAVPTTVGGRYRQDGGPYWLPPDSGPLIRFSFPVTWATGAGFGETGELAAELASHLAAMAGDWPSETAHTVLLPVTDFSFTFEATPGERKAAPPVPVPAGITAALEQVRAAVALTPARTGLES